MMSASYRFPKFVIRISSILIAAFLTVALVGAQPAGKFVSGYYPSWSVWSYPPEAVDYDALTHILHFAADVIADPPYVNILATPAATIEWETAGTGRNHLRALLDSAHAHGTKVLLSIANVAFYGGNNAVMSAITADSVTCQTFVDNALNYCRSVGYDGIDINWEWPNSSDRPGYSRMMRMFRRGLDAFPERGTLSHTIYVLMSNTPGNYGAYDVPLLNQIVDQHNMECYGLGFWQSNRRFGYTFALNPAVETIEAPGGYYDAISLTDPDHNTDLGYNTGPAGAVRQGWARNKIGVGVGFLYYHSASPEPLLIGGTNIGTWQNYYRFYYSDIIGTGAGQFGAHPRQWNDEAKSPYKRWTENGVYNFVTYEDSMSLALKTRSAIDSGYGGMMIYELSTGYISTDPGIPWSVPGYTGVKDPLLKAIKVEMGMTGGGAEPDVVAPVVAVNAPAAGDTVSGTVEITATASDDRGSPRVSFTVDGDAVGGTLYGPPYRVFWSSEGASNGPHTVRATATDGGGNQSHSEMTLEVYNEPVVEDSTAAAGFALFEDTLNTEWVDASWNAVNTFNSTEQVMEGSTSVKTEQQGWGGLMLRAGSVTAPADFDPTPFENIRFSVYPETPGLSLMVTFENDLRDPFMTNVVSALPTGEWSEIVIPVEQINPTGNSIIHNVMIQNWTPSAKTYFVDDYRFSGNAVTDAGGRPQVPEGYILAQNYPNPFNPTTTIEYELAAEGLVTIQVFNMLGELVATPLDRRASAGRHSLVWDAVGSSGAPLPSGVYTYRLVVAGSGGPVQKTMKMILMK